MWEKWKSLEQWAWGIHHCLKLRAAEQANAHIAAGGVCRQAAMCSPVWRAAKVHHFGTTAGSSCKHLIWMLECLLPPSNPFHLFYLNYFQNLPITLIIGSVNRKCPRGTSCRSLINLQGATIQPGRQFKAEEQCKPLEPQNQLNSWFWLFSG